jgi:hypothetical protein
MLETEIDPFFGDIAESVKTAVLHMAVRNSEEVKNHDQWIRIKETTEPVLVYLPIVKKAPTDTGDVIEDVLVSNDGIVAQVKMIPIEEMDHTNTNLKIHHLTLIHGARFYVYVRTLSSVPGRDYSGVQYMVRAGVSQ